MKNSTKLNTYRPCSSNGKESSCNSGDPDSISGLGRSAGEGNGSPLQYSCLEDSMDGGAWQATVREITESDTTQRLSLLLLLFILCLIRSRCSIITYVKSFCVIWKSSPFSFLYFKTSFFECLGVHISSSLNIGREVHLYKF